MQCPTCKQPVKESKPHLLDATGRGFDVLSILVYMVPFNEVNRGGVRIKMLGEPIGYDPVVVIPDTIESDGRQWVMYARELHDPDRFHTITGTCWDKQPTLYKIADNIGGMP